jgi:L-serine dehydratase
MTGASIGGGSIRITSINDFDTDVSGKYPSFVILNSDIPGALSQIVGEISSSNMNISNLFLSRVDPFRKEALCVVELDNEPDESLLSAVKRLQVVKKVSYLERLDSSI